MTKHAHAQHYTNTRTIHSNARTHARTHNTQYIHTHAHTHTHTHTTRTTHTYVTVVLSVPTVRIKLDGNVLVSTTTVALPEGTVPDVYEPSEPVVTVCVPPAESVIVTSTLASPSP